MLLWIMDFSQKMPRGGYVKYWDMGSRIVDIQVW